MMVSVGKEVCLRFKALKIIRFLASLLFGMTEMFSISLGHSWSCKAFQSDLFYTVMMRFHSYNKHCKSNNENSFYIFQFLF